jgi:hypothetical protein
LPSIYAPIAKPAQLEHSRTRQLARGNIAGPKTRVAQNITRKNMAIARPNIASNNLGIIITPNVVGLSSPDEQLMRYLLDNVNR